jgi:hypothetical protein
MISRTQPLLSTDTCPKKRGTRRVAIAFRHIDIHYIMAFFAIVKAIHYPLNFERCFKKTGLAAQIAIDYQIQNKQNAERIAR